MIAWLARMYYRHKYRDDLREREASRRYIMYLTEQLENREKLLSSIIDNQQDMVCRYKPDTELTFVNLAYRKAFGRREQDLIGTRFIDLIPKEDHPAVLDRVRAMTIAQPVIRYAHRVHTPQGIRWHEWIDNAIVQDGIITGYQAVGRDVTEQKQLERKLIEQRDMLDSILETQSDCIVRCTLDRTICYANRAYSRTFCGVEDYRQCLANDLIHYIYDGDRQYVMDLFEQFVHKPPYRASAIFRIVDSDSQVRLFRWQAYGITDTQDRLIEIQGVGREVSS